NNGDVNTYIVPANEKTKKVRRVYPYIGAKWGFNNYLENGKFAQGMQKVKPWGSWEAGVYIGSSFRFGKWFRLPAEISFTWFNFKFSEPSVRYATDSSRQPYLYYDTNPDLTYMKSKLSAPYVNFELCPTFVIIPTHLSIGVGGYVGYNLGGRNKYKYLTNGEKYKDHIKASCFEAFRYGVKAEVNLRFISFYATYDLSNVYCNLTADNNVLKVNPVCFGIELTFAR
ncbi:MAG: outer membrane beta-barrel protein, partial [Bacteroidales bacterium]|nr:outer membrane beta-barrel protein [Bacteroidales bacterium]